MSLTFESCLEEIATASTADVPEDPGSVLTALPWRGPLSASGPSTGESANAESVGAPFLTAEFAFGTAAEEAVCKAMLHVCCLILRGKQKKVAHVILILN